MMDKVLTKAEEQIMQALWKLKSGFLKDIVEAMPEPQPHSNTVATLLKILIEKGFVKYETFGRNNHYQPAVSKEAYGKKTANHLLKSYFDGSALSLVSQFAQNKQLSVEDLELLLKQVKKK